MKIPSEERQEEMMDLVMKAGYGYDPARVLSHEVVMCYDHRHEFVFIRVVEGKLYAYTYAAQLL